MVNWFFGFGYIRDSLHDRDCCERGASRIPRTPTQTTDENQQLIQENLKKIRLDIMRFAVGKDWTLAIAFGDAHSNSGTWQFVIYFWDG